MTLPTAKRKPSTVMSDYNILIYGPPKIGKSTWCSNIDGAVFLATEPGLNALECYQVDCPKWTNLLEAAKELAEAKHPFKCIVIDTIDNAFTLCSEHICQKNGVDYLGDMAHGKGWAMVSNEFQRVLTKLAHLPMGLVMTSHSIEKEIQSKIGTTTKIQPTLPERGKRVVLGLVDFILYCEVEEAIGDTGKIIPKRVIRTKPSPRYDAGDRTGELPETIELDYSKFLAAFTETNKKEIKK